MKKISIIVPMYNEQEVIEIFIDEIKKLINANNKYYFEVIAINDGSKDKTLQILNSVQENFKNLVIVDLSRNFGQEAAMAAGLEVATGDAAVIMDADLQDPPEVLSEMIVKWEEGYKVINAKRASRDQEPFIKRFTAEQFYNVVNLFDEKVKIPKNVGNYRLMDRVVIDKINELPEKNRVYKILIPFVGFKTTEIEFVRPERAAGNTSYNIKSLFKLATDSITSTTIAPLKLATRVGLIIVTFGFLSAIFLTFRKIVINDASIEGWTSMMAIMIFLGGIQILFLGLLGEYIGRIFIETKNRPVYYIESIKRTDNEE